MLHWFLILRRRQHDHTIPILGNEDRPLMFIRSLPEVYFAPCLQLVAYLYVLIQPTT